VTRLISGLLLLVAWQLAALAVSGRLLPGPVAVAEAMLREIGNGLLLASLAITLARVAVSFVLAMLGGVAVGVAMGWWRRLDRLFDLWLILLLNLPALVLVVLLYVWFGLNDAALVAAVALTKLPATAVTLREGVRTLDPALTAMARSFRLTRASVLHHVVLPQLAPYLFASARTGLALIWKIVLLAEVLGRSSGVGFEIGISFQVFDVTRILAYCLAFVAVAQGFEGLVLHPLERRVTRWRG
jgi:NitT/TauT family transport system permease protein